MLQPASAVALGLFDGVHIGHRAVLAAAVACQADGLTPAAFTMQTTSVRIKRGEPLRYLYPDETDAYSWWSYRAAARERNVGWRIDYFCVSECLKERLVSASIHTEVTGSDHCPVELVIS